VPNLLRNAIQSIQTGISGLRIGGSKASLKPGLCHYQRQSQNERSRIHLRIDPDESGILVVNATRILHLNLTAVWMAHLFLEQTPDQDAIKVLCDRFDITYAKAEKDYLEFCSQVAELILADGTCPVHELNIETTAPFKQPSTAPYRMDLALTYRCNNDCAHCYNARPRDFHELETQEWFLILDKLWEIGIPHIVFTGGEPTLRSDLPELIAHAEQNGQITGINTNGRRLSDPVYVQKLVDSGLDHVQVTLESHNPVIHDRMVRNHGAWLQTTRGLVNILETELYVMTNTTLLADNAPDLENTLEFLANLNVATVGLNALIYSGNGLTVNKGLPETELQPLLQLARAMTDQYNQKLIWYTPTQYCHFDPVLIDLGVKGCTAALYNMCIEPNGDVIPCQSYYQMIGNVLEQRWEQIWNHPLAERLRARQYAPAGCSNCAIFSECGGGCPLSLGHNEMHIKPF
jgi:radical SAM protein with 4Fe4S-binding SPASM domain